MPPIVPGVGGIWTISHSLAGVIGVFIFEVVCTESISSSVFPGLGPRISAWRATRNCIAKRALIIISCWKSGSERLGVSSQHYTSNIERRLCLHAKSNIALFE